MDTLLAVTPLPPLVGVEDLAQRWGIGKSAVPRWVNREGFPEGAVIGQTSVWAEADIEQWEKQQLDAGEPLPGQKPRGREPRGGR